MPFRQTFQPQFRDADPDGLIGLRGAMRYFQDIHTWYMHSMEKGNDVLPELYGAAWVYTRYIVSLSRKIDYTDTIDLTSWMEPYRQPVLVNVDFTIEQHGIIAARGRSENCVFSLDRQRPLRLGAIDFPTGATEDISIDIPGFLPIDRTVEGMTERYRRNVRFSDIDKSRHMNNLRYIEMFEDAYDASFWKTFAADCMQLVFLSQCREGEELSVLAIEGPDSVRLAAVHAGGAIAALALFSRRDRS